jgi:hypothetical protein
MIYFIRAGADGPVKIGYAASVERRVALIQAGNHQRFTLLRTLPGERQTEGWLHRHFAAARIDREWFAFDVDMLTVEPPAIAEHLRIPRGRANYAKHPLGAWLGEAGMSLAEFAVKLGVHQDAVRKWLHSQRVPRVAQLAAIKRMTAGRVTANDFQPAEMAA